MWGGSKTQDFVKKIALHFTATKIENASLFTLLMGSRSPKLQRRKGLQQKLSLCCSRNSYPARQRFLAFSSWWEMRGSSTRNCTILWSCRRPQPGTNKLKKQLLTSLKQVLNLRMADVSQNTVRLRDRCQYPTSLLVKFLASKSFFSQLFSSKTYFSCY